MRRMNIFSIAAFIALISANCLLASKGFDVQVNKSSGNSIGLDYELEDFKIIEVEKNGKTYSQILFDGSVTTMQKGFAEVPKISASVQLSNNKNVSMEVVGSDYQEIKLNYPLLPSRGTIYRNQNPADIPYEIAKEAQEDAWYPKNLAEKSTPYIIRNVRGTNVYVYPFRYNAAQQSLRVFKNVEVKLSENNTTPVNPLKTQDSQVMAEMKNVYSSLFLNFDSDQKFGNQIGEMGEILVIHTSRDASAITPYVQWKKEKGYKVHTKQVATGTNVKSIVQDAYDANNNILYVLLVGDWADIKSDTGTSQNAPMDPMLGCVSGNDNYPDIIVGRFSANSASDVTTQVNKVITYEKANSGTWYDKAIGIASNEGAGAGDDNESDEEQMESIRNNRLIPFGYDTVYKDYQANGADDNDVKQQLNSGAGIINYVGHGSETSFVATGFDVYDINNLNNGDKLPFIMAVACVNGKFHRSSGDCFGEAWLKKDNGGAIATIMSTINQPWQPPMRGQDYFNDLLIGGYNYSSNPGSGTNTSSSDMRTTFGSLCFNADVLMYAESNGTNDLETIQTWTVFGDPSVQVRTKTPQTVGISNEEIGNNTFTTKITTGGTAVKSALVSLYNNGQTYSALTDSYGNVTINHSISSGTVKLVVTGYNLATIYKEIEVNGTALQAPKNLAATINEESVTLNWDSSAKGFKNYKIYRDNVLKANVSGTSYTDNTVQNNNSYTYHVTALYDEGESASSNQVSVDLTTPGQLPFTDNFEDGYDGWTIKNKNDGWMHGDKTSLQSSTYWDFNGNETKFLGANPDAAGKEVNVVDYAITPVLKLTGSENVSLTFDYKLKKGSGSYRDELKVMYRTSQTGSWTELEELIDAESWTNHTITLPSAAISATTQLAFYFNDFDTWGYGGGIDNIEIKGSTVNPLPHFTISTKTINFGEMVVGNTQEKSFTISNDGSADMTGTITADINGFSIAEVNKKGAVQLLRKEQKAALRKRDIISYNIAAGSSKSFKIIFTPANSGDYNGNMTITSNDTEFSSTKLSVSGYAEFLTAPGNLTHSISGKNVTLNWNAPSRSLQEYIIYRNNNEITTTTSSSYTDMNLAVGNYSYFVKAKYTTGESDASNSVSLEIINDNTASGLSEGFEKTNSIPEGWNVINNDNDSNPWLIKTNSSTAHEGQNYASVRYNASGCDDWLISKKVSGGGILKFWAKSYHSSYLESFKVHLLRDGQQINNVVASSGELTDVPTTWKEYSFDLSSQTGDYYIAWQCTSVDEYYLFIDDISLEVSKSGTESEDAGLIASTTELLQNYPNPFNPTTTIKFSNADFGQVKLTVFNSKGEVVANLLNKQLNAGKHAVEFNGANLNSGVYYYQLQTQGKSFTKKMILIK